MVKVYKWFVNILFIIVIAFLLVYLVFRATDKVEIYRVKTGSMEDKIHAGDYIMIYRKDTYNVGEIVTYTSNDGFITHRIIRKEGNKIVTKGDANNAEDREIVASTIVGEAILIGGILNIIIDFKYVIICVLIALYLFSCYFGDGEEKGKPNNDDSSVEEKNVEEKTSEEIKEEIKVEEKTEDVVQKEEKKEETEEEIKDIKETPVVLEKKEEKVENKEEVKEDLEKEETLIKKKEKKEK